jgi:hypothetical protein
MITFLLYLWQLPQTIVGLILLAYCKLFKSAALIESYPGMGIRVYRVHGIPGSISLGTFVFVSEGSSDTTKQHELGHSVQSYFLGPIYLLVIGIPSITWASLYGTKLFPATSNGYYTFYTEKWADKLAGIERK